MYGNFVALCKEGKHDDEANYQTRMAKEIYTLHDSSEKSTHHLIAWIKDQMKDAIVEEVTWIPNKEMTIDSLTYEKVKAEIILSMISGGKLTILKWTRNSQIAIHRCF